MPKSYVLVTMEIEDSQSPDTLRFGTGKTALQRLEEVIIRAKSNQPRVRVGYCPIDDSGDLPTGSIVVDTAGGAPAEGETITFTLFSAAAVLTVGTDIPSTTDEAVLADAIAAAITKHPQIGTVIEAVSDSVDTVALTARFPGDVLENIVVTTSDATTFTVTTIGAGTSGTPSEAAYFPVGKQYA